MQFICFRGHLFVSPVPLGAGKEKMSVFVWVDVNRAKSRGVGAFMRRWLKRWIRASWGEGNQGKGGIAFAAETTPKLQIDGFEANDRTSH